MVFYADYYPFGTVLRSGGAGWRYGYQGENAEKDNETGWNSFELRNYDAAIGRWLSTDPYGQYASPYVGMGNNPVNGIDPDGGFWQEFKNWLFHDIWISNDGLDYLRNTPNASFEGWEGDRLNGYAKVISTNPMENSLDEVNINLFKGVQDYTFGGVDIFFDMDFNITAGARLSMLAKSIHGFDVNLGSLTLFNYNFIKNKTSTIADGYFSYSAGYSVAYAGTGYSFGTNIKSVKGVIEGALIKAGAGKNGISAEIAFDAAKKKFSSTISFTEMKFGAGIVTEIVPKIVVRQHEAFHY